MRLQYQQKRSKRIVFIQQAHVTMQDDDSLVGMEGVYIPESPWFKSSFG